MTNEIKKEIDIDDIHAQAICRGIGERLRDDLERSHQPAPQKLHELWRRLPELDRERSPSIVPPVVGGF
ncbi:MAG: hypothetical protein J0I29_11255 [Rhizobiales bacterium]|nr:hypothetical protein [Hyphomicrobiales bacterium]